MKTKGFVVLFAIAALALGLFSMDCLLRIDDEEDDDDDKEYCDIEGEDLTAVPFSEFENECEEVLGLAMTLDRVLADSTLTVFKVQGQFSIVNDNEYFVRGRGLGEDLCFDRIEGSGTYSVLVEYLECATEVTLDVVTSTERDAIGFCDLSFAVDLDCDDDDDDDDQDDDVGDDDDDDSAEDDDEEE